MKRIKLNAYAKINLWLAVTGRAENGYHTVETVMQAVSLCDFVTVGAEAAEESGIALGCSEPSLPTDERNLAFRAAQCFLNALPEKKLSVEIGIEKHIPIAGGLAGGSTDAAAVLHGLNVLTGNALSREKLLDIGATLGADVPFCIAADAPEAGVTAALGTHFGERLAPLPKMPDCTVLLIPSAEAVSTPWAYGLTDALPSDASGAYIPLKEALSAGDLPAVLGNTYNRFEDAVLPHRPLAAKQMRFLRDEGADAVRMSGSGPTVIGFFAGADGICRAEAAADLLRERGEAAWLCRPV